MMKNSLWVLLITMQAFVQYGQTQSVRDNDFVPLSMDQASLIITNEDYPEPIIVEYQLVVCENCSYDILADHLRQNAGFLTTVDTRYGHRFQFFIPSSNRTIQCEKNNSYDFREYGNYSLRISGNSPDNSSCQISPQGPEPNAIDYWLPVIVGFGTLFIIILIIQIWRCASRRPGYIRCCPKRIQSESIIYDLSVSLPRSPDLVTNDSADDIVGTLLNGNELTLTGTSSRAPIIPKPKPEFTPKRLRSLDAFRGFSLMIMVFVNYGGGGYWFFKHSIWNGLTLADMVFPWFTWMMGISIVLSQRSLRARNVRKITIFSKICRRTLILFLLGLILQAGWSRFVFVRILGVLQRLALCYFITALIVLIFDDKEDEPYNAQWSTGDSRHPLRSELKQAVLHFWPQWFIVLLLVLTWVLVTFLAEFKGCPKGYLGPGGKHDQGIYQNCTGGIAGYIDRMVLQSTHVFNHPTCKEIYDTQVPFDPEGLLGVLTGTLLCYLGVQAGHSFVHASSVGRVCGHWLVSGVLCGTIGLILSKGGQSDSWIPINKNLWSLSFVLVLAGLAFIILTILYLLVDVSKWFTGEPFLWLGMNSIVIYVGHEACGKAFPVQFQVEETTHAQLIAMHLYGVMFWTIIAGLMYRQKFFIAI